MVQAVRHNQRREREKEKQQHWIYGLIGGFWFCGMVNVVVALVVIYWCITSP